MGIRRLLDSDTDRRYAGMMAFGFALASVCCCCCWGGGCCCFAIDEETAFDFGCFMVEMRSGTWARADADFVSLTVCKWWERINKNHYSDRWKGHLILLFYSLTRAACHFGLIHMWWRSWCCFDLCVVFLWLLIMCLNGHSDFVQIVSPIIWYNSWIRHRLQSNAKENRNEENRSAHELKTFAYLRSDICTSFDRLR